MCFLWGTNWTYILIRINSVFNTAPAQEDQPLVSSKRRLHFSGEDYQQFTVLLYSVSTRLINLKLINEIYKSEASHNIIIIITVYLLNKYVNK
jgi:hypothetical protein